MTKWDEIPKIHVLPDDVLELERSPMFVPVECYGTTRVQPNEVGAIEMQPADLKTIWENRDGVWCRTYYPAFRVFLAQDGHGTQNKESAMDILRYLKEYLENNPYPMISRGMNWDLLLGRIRRLTNP